MKATEVVTRKGSQTDENKSDFMLLNDRMVRGVVNKKEIAQLAGQRKEELLIGKSTK